MAARSTSIETRGTYGKGEAQMAIEALYLHVPFCVKRCTYCDFPTVACGDDALMDAYVDALSLQLRRASRAGLLGSVRTVYVGGGTPTHLGTRRLSSLVYLLSLSVNLEDVGEFTLECNPESLTAPMVKDLYALGVDRFSIGAQSFDDAELSAYERAHDAAAVYHAVASVKERTGNFSLDLICGGPGQTHASWERSVRAAIGLGARHVSVYPLSVEEETPLAAAIEAGEWDGPDEGAQADMMLSAARLLEQAGMRRYEVASYAYPGCESRHNTAYWTGAEYLGLGAGASSCCSAATWRRCLEAGLFAPSDPEAAADVPGTARVRAAAYADPQAFAAAGGRAAVGLETLSARDAALEDVMLGFRRSEGVDASLLEAAARLVPELPATLRALVQRGLVAEREGRHVPTGRGWLMGNELYGAIWALASI